MKLMKRKLFAIMGILLLVVGLFVAINYSVLSKKQEFYGGVTYCGSSVQEAKELIDKVKDYTNLFVLQSGPFMTNIEAMNEIGNYVIASNLNYAISGGELNKDWINSWLIEAKQKWGDQFIGIYYFDEPGGNMLDGYVELEVVPYKGTGTYYSSTQPKLTNHPTIGVTYYMYDENYNREAIYSYTPDGEVVITKFIHQDVTSFHYFSNGTITVYETISNDPYSSNFYTSENITKYTKPIQPYEEVLKQKPIQTHDDVAKAFVNMNKQRLDDINKKQ
ncbi:MAG: hypothetical protein LBE76_00270, partial [Nitrososphaerota archaeon]|nr:hypothetical protein [Nitrososphaerota archaeon]